MCQLHGCKAAALFVYCPHIWFRHNYQFQLWIWASAIFKWFIPHVELDFFTVVPARSRMTLSIHRQ